MGDDAPAAQQAHREGREPCCSRETWLAMKRPGMSQHMGFTTGGHVMSIAGHSHMPVAEWADASAAKEAHQQG